MSYLGGSYEYECEPLQPGARTHAPRRRPLPAVAPKLIGLG